MRSTRPGAASWRPAIFSSERQSSLSRSIPAFIASQQPHRAHSEIQHFIGRVHSSQFPFKASRRLLTAFKFQHLQPHIEEHVRRWSHRPAGARERRRAPFSVSGALLEPSATAAPPHTCQRIPPPLEPRAVMQRQRPCRQRTLS